MLGIIDGDVLCHMACEQPWKMKVERLQQGGVETSRLKGLGEIPGYNAEADTRVFDTCWRNFEEIVRESLDALFCTEHLMAVKDGKSYRDDIYSEYKKNRGKWRIHNPFVELVRRRAVEQQLAVYATDKEADDLIRIWAEESRKTGVAHAVISIDKDLYCIEGMHYNPKKKEVKTVSASEAMWHYYSQLLSGDPTDHIPGLPRVGPKIADKLIRGIATEEECQEVVVAMYFEKFGDDWAPYLLSNGKMIHIQKHWNDHFTIRNWPAVEGLL